MGHSRRAYRAKRQNACARSLSGALTTVIKPDFFIVGAPKCGTTAMYQYLKAHPEVFMPAYKEPHYFAEDFHGAWIERFRQQEDYLKLFADAGNAKRVGEA